MVCMFVFACVCLWGFVHVSFYLRTRLPVCLGRGNHYAYYAYRHHEGKNIHHTSSVSVAMVDGIVARGCSDSPVGSWHRPGSLNKKPMGFFLWIWAYFEKSSVA